MTNNNSIPVAPSLPDLVVYSPKVNLVEIRRDPVTYPRISAGTEEEAVNKMRPLIWAAFLYRGQEATKTSLDFIAVTLVREILNDTKFGLPSLSWQEIGMVIRRSVLGAAKELYGVSVASLYAALVEYAKNEGHEAARQAQAYK